MKKCISKKRLLIREKFIDECPKCGVRCTTISQIHPSPMLMCPRCGQLINNPNYDVSFVGYH